MGKKLIMIAGAASVLLLGGGFFGYQKFKKAKTPDAAVEKEADAHGESEKPSKEEEEEPAVDAHGKPVQPTIVVYKNIVNLDRKNAFLKVEFNVVVKDEELGKALNSDKPTLEGSEFRSLMLGLLSGKTLEEASSLETRESLCMEIKDRLNEKFGHKKNASKEKGKKGDGHHKSSKHPIKDVLVVDWGVSS